MAFHVVFSHGKESGPNGSKIQLLSQVAREHGASVDSIDYTDVMDPDLRVDRLLDSVIAWREPQAATAQVPLILVGSSMGAYVSLVAAARLKPAGVFLMAPALYIPGWNEQHYTTDVPVSIVHGWQDEIIPVEHPWRYAQQARCELHMLDADHRLSDQEDNLRILFDSFIRRLLMAS